MEKTPPSSAVWDSRPNSSYNRKIRTRKQETDVDKYSFVNRTIKSWNQLRASLLASFPSKLHTFRKTVKNVVTSKGIQSGGLSVNKWSDVKCSDVEWTDVTYVKWLCSEVKWIYGEVLGDKSTMYCTLGWPYTEGTWLYCDYLIWCVSCTVVVLTCFVMCGCVYVWVL